MGGDVNEGNSTEFRRWERRTTEDRPKSSGRMWKKDPHREKKDNIIRIGRALRCLEKNVPGETTEKVVVEVKLASDEKERKGVKAEDGSTRGVRERG